MRTFLPDTPFSRRGDSLPLPIQIEFPVKISMIIYGQVQCGLWRDWDGRMDMHMLPFLHMSLHHFILV